MNLPASQLVQQFRSGTSIDCQRVVWMELRKRIIDLEKVCQDIGGNVTADSNESQLLCVHGPRETSKFHRRFGNLQRKRQQCSTFGGQFNPATRPPEK